MCRSGELVDGLEPHDQFYLGVMPVRCHADQRAMVGGVPGVAGWVGTWEGYYTGTPSLARLRLI